MIALLSVVVLLGAAVPDTATVDAKKHFAAGRAEYDLGHFDTALAEFESGYRNKPLPAFLFNIGQCHFQEERYDKAVYFYERYLELSPRAENRVLVEELLVEARREARPLPERLFLHDEADAPTPRSGAASRDESEPQPWLWIGVGSAVAVVATGVALAFALAPRDPAPGSLGVLDGRNK